MRSSTRWKTSFEVQEDWLEFAKKPSLHDACGHDVLYLQFYSSLYIFLAPVWQEHWLASYTEFNSSCHSGSFGFFFEDNFRTFSQQEFFQEDPRFGPDVSMLFILASWCILIFSIILFKYSKIIICLSLLYILRNVEKGIRRESYSPINCVIWNKQSSHWKKLFKIFFYEFVHHSHIGINFLCRNYIVFWWIVTIVAELSKFRLWKKSDHGKNFLWAQRLWVGRL